MPSLLHHLTVPDTAPDDAWVKRATLAELLRQIAGTTLGVEGYSAITLSNGLRFQTAATEGSDYPFEIALVGDGFTFTLGRVIGITINGTGSTNHIPKINGTAINATVPPRLEARAAGIVCVELKVRFNRGTPPIPYNPTMQLTAAPEVKWQTDIAEAGGVIDGTDYSYATVAVPLWQVIGIEYTRLRWTQVNLLQSFITHLLV